jgi:DNA-binding SARP family transcriptional activator/streptogramin lyase
VPLDVRLLGPLTVLVAGRPARLGKGNERLVVALLALNAGRTVTGERIIDVLWPEAPPPTAREMVRIYVARTRKQLGADAVVTRPGGYSLETDPEHVDALRFVRLCAEGSSWHEEGKLAEVVATVDKALALWRGTPLPELTGPFLEGERARLEELRLTAIEHRFDAELELGHAQKIIAELESLTREHPYRERLRGQLMLALYRSGRQKDALEQFRHARWASVEELGVEPGPDLQNLQKAILTHDPALRLPPARSSTPQPSVTTGASGRLRSRTALALAVVALVAAAAIAAGVTLHGGGSGTSIASDSIGLIDAHTGGVHTSLKLAGLPGPIAVANTHIWVGDGERRLVRELDAKTLRATREIALPDFPYRAVGGFGAVWIANGYDGRVIRIDGSTGVRVVFRPEPQASGRTQLAVAYGSLWTASQDGVLVRLDPRTTRATALIRHIGFPGAMTAGLGGIWVAQSTRDEILRIDPATNRIVRRIPIGGIASDVAVGDGAVWTVTPREGKLWRIDPRTNGVTGFTEIDGRPSAVAVTPDAVWVGSARTTITRVNPKSGNHPAKTVAVGGAVSALLADGNRVWVSVR